MAHLRVLFSRQPLLSNTLPSLERMARQMADGALHLLFQQLAELGLARVRHAAQAARLLPGAPPRARLGLGARAPAAAAAARIAAAAVVASRLRADVGEVRPSAVLSGHLKHIVLVE